LYYVAMVLNVMIRFVWIIYVPGGSFNSQLLSVVAASLEMLRRILWNFFRVENEHIGNADQYRVTREIPLPYSFDNIEPRDDSDNDEDDKTPNNRRSRGVLPPRARESFGDTEAHPPRSVPLAAIQSDGTGSESGRRSGK